MFLLIYVTVNIITVIL